MRGWQILCGGSVYKMTRAICGNSTLVKRWVKWICFSSLQIASQLPRTWGPYSRNQMTALATPKSSRFLQCTCRTSWSWSCTVLLSPPAAASPHVTTQPSFPGQGPQHIWHFMAMIAGGSLWEPRLECASMCIVYTARVGENGVPVDICRSCLGPRGDTCDLGEGSWPTLVIHSWQARLDKQSTLSIHWIAIEYHWIA